MSNKTHTGPLILGASGQIGQMLYQLWDQGALDFGAAPVWQMRRAIEDHKQSLIWDILGEPAPPMNPSAVICLAGGPHVDTNVALARAAAQIADGAPLLYASTQAVYGAQNVILTEQTECTPGGDYGVQKRAAEEVLAAYPNAICLRIGNVIGADSLLRAIQKGPVPLDQFADGQGPRRMWIGPKALGQAFIDLLAEWPTAAPIMNLAQPGLIAMEDLLEAAKAPWFWQSAPETAIPSLALDLTRVQRHIDLLPATPEGLLEEAHAAGWRATT